MSQPALRRDLEWIRYEGQDRWVARDPISNAFYYFSNLEYQVCQQLNGKRTLEEVLRTLRLYSVSSLVDLEWLRYFLIRLHGSRLLLLTDTSSEREKKPSKIRISSFASLLSLRVPLFRWTRYPAILYPLARFFFHRLNAILLVLGLIVSVGLVFNRALRSEASLFTELAKQPAVWWLKVFLCYLAIKSLHEISHMLACIRWRVACSEVGLLFLVFTPCFYCDTTESWRLSSKWKRAAIAFAGIYAELWIAVFAGIIYSLTLPGLIHGLAGTTFAAATVGTLLVNANPFFRFDGYYILSDVWGVPNLASQSRKALWRTCMWCLGGAPVRKEEYDADFRWLCLFGLCSIVYRWLILSAIVLFLWHFFSRLGLSIVGVVFLGSIAAGMLIALNRGVTVLMSEFMTKQPIRGTRFLVLLSVFVVMSFLFFTYPLPNGRYARGFAEYDDKHAIFWPTEGVLTAISELGNHVKKGDVVAQGRNSDRELEILDASSNIQQLEIRLQNLLQLATIDESVIKEIQPLQELLKERRGRLERLSSELRALTIIAPSSGHILVTSGISPQALSSESETTEWAPVLRRVTIESFLERGTLLAEISEKRKIRFVAVVPETLAKRIPPGATATAVPDASPEKSISLKLQSIGIDIVDDVPLPIQSDSSFVFRRNELGAMRFESPHYLAIFFTDDHECLDSSLASFRIHLPMQTLSEQIWLQILEAFLVDRR